MPQTMTMRMAPTCQSEAGLLTLSITIAPIGYAADSV